MSSKKFTQDRSSSLKKMGGKNQHSFMENCIYKEDTKIMMSLKTRHGMKVLDVTRTKWNRSTLKWK